MLSLYLIYTLNNNIYVIKINKIQQKNYEIIFFIKIILIKLI